MHTRSSFNFSGQSHACKELGNNNGYVSVTLEYSMRALQCIHTYIHTHIHTIGCIWKVMAPDECHIYAILGGGTKHVSPETVQGSVRSSDA